MRQPETSRSKRIPKRAPDWTLPVIGPAPVDAVLGEAPSVRSGPHGPGRRNSCERCRLLLLQRALARADLKLRSSFDIIVFESTHRLMVRFVVCHGLRISCNGHSVKNPRLFLCKQCQTWTTVKLGLASTMVHIAAFLLAALFVLLLA